MPPITDTLLYSPLCTDERYHGLLSMAAYNPNFDAICQQQTFTQEMLMKSFPESTEAPWTLIQQFGPTPSGGEGFTVIIPGTSCSSSSSGTPELISPFLVRQRWTRSSSSSRVCLDGNRPCESSFRRMGEKQAETTARGCFCTASPKLEFCSRTDHRVPPPFPMTATTRPQTVSLLPALSLASPGKSRISC